MENGTLLQKLFSMQAHWGHQKRFREPQMKTFIYKTINNLDVINLEYTVSQIEKAKNLISKYSRNDILVISNRSDLSIKKWKPGSLTNFNFGNLIHKPKLMIVDRTDQNLIALKEAMSCSIQTIGFCDTNSSLNNIKQPIIINDDNDKCIKFLLSYLLD